ncbi:MAG: 3-dehydroquinate synthase [Legionella sp.]|jgi:3-dehydroquinate synthase|nr:3-dehydroquinate synthase [Legionella sp.]
MGKPEVFQEVDVELPYKRYTILIGRHLLHDAALFKAAIPGTQALIVTNRTLAPLYLDNVRQAIQQHDIQCHVVVLPDGEVHKTQASVSKIHEALIQHQHHRDTVLIALGGGVIGDMTGFAASTYHRGVACIQIPTTLLAQVDSAVGGKTAINYPGAKNAVGSFHQPSAVIIDLNTLDTLPEREFRAGLAEVIKYGLLVGGDFFESLKHALFNQEALPKLIATCCQIKANFVRLDEREATGHRALLNLGHTFAHALEAVTNYERWLHGEAVAIGLYCAARLSYQLGYLSQDDVEQLDTLLSLAGLPRRIPADIALSAVYERMYHDKKVRNNVLRFILIKKIGVCYVDTSITEHDVKQVLADAVSFA